MKFPNDETGSILQEMHDAGIDLNSPLPVEFFQLFEQEKDARAMAEFLSTDMPQAVIKVHPDKTSNVWDLDVTLTMLPSHEYISAQEEAFVKIAAKFNGYNDGWGVRVD